MALKIQLHLSKTPIANFHTLLEDAGYPREIMKAGKISPHELTDLGVDYSLGVANTEVVVSMEQGGFERLTMDQEVTTNPNRLTNPATVEQVKQHMLELGYTQDEIDQAQFEPTRDETRHQYRRLDVLKEFGHGEDTPAYLEERVDPVTKEFRVIDLAEVEEKIRQGLTDVKFPTGHFNLFKISEPSYVSSPAFRLTPIGDMCFCAIDSNLYVAKKINLVNRETNELYTTKFIRDQDRTYDNRLHSNPITNVEWNVVSVPSIDFVSKTRGGSLDTVSDKLAEQFQNDRFTIFSQAFNTNLKVADASGAERNVTDVPYVVLGQRLGYGLAEEALPSGKVSPLTPENHQFNAPTAQEETKFYYENNANVFYAGKNNLADYFGEDLFDTDKTGKVSVLHYVTNPFLTHNQHVKNDKKQITGRGNVFVLAREYDELVDEFVEEYANDRNVLVNTYVENRGSDENEDFSKVRLANRHLSKATSVTKETVEVDGENMTALVVNVDGFVNKRDIAERVFLEIMDGLKTTFNLPDTNKNMVETSRLWIRNEDERFISLVLEADGHIQGKIQVKLVFGTELRVPLTLDGFDTAVDEAGRKFSSEYTINEPDRMEDLTYTEYDIRYIDGNVSEHVELSGLEFLFNVPPMDQNQLAQRESDYRGLFTMEKAALVYHGTRNPDGTTTYRKFDGTPVTEAEMQIQNNTWWPPTAGVVITPIGTQTIQTRVPGRKVTYKDGVRVDVE